MSATDNGPASGDDLSDHAYFRAVEDAFIRLRGAPFLLSPEDWRVASGWRRAGVPLDLVERVLERVLRQREESESGRARRIRSLRYFDSAVGAAWKGLRAVAGSDSARQSAPLDREGRLAALAESLPPELPEREDLARRIREIDGPTEQVEDRLADLDGQMLAAVARSLSGARRAELARRVESGLQRMAERLPESERDSARQRLERQILRRMVGLPLLSLFSPQARASTDA